ncbi:MAG TPA: peptidylprolyl isomerase [Pyrinomonadaceae bacterium]|jgi:cyclophilin family peptidyl-prolyl cis-trans isomerase/HEAT repeat protein
MLNTEVYRARVRRGAPALLLCALCCAPSVRAQQTPAATTPKPKPRAAAPAKPKPGAQAEEIMLRIMRAEDERRWDASDLGALLAAKSPAVRSRAALAAGRIGDEGAVAPLVALLRQDEDVSVRAMAAFALGEIESGAAAAALLEALRTSQSATVRGRAVEALGKIAAALPAGEEARKKSIGEAILNTLTVARRQAAPPASNAAAVAAARNVELLGLTAALRARPADAGKVLALYLNAPDARVRADAANALARLRAKDGVEQLRALLAADADAVVRANAARALGTAEDKQSVDALVRRASEDEDERVRVSAVRALATLDEARAAEPLARRGAALLVAYRAAKANTSHPAELNELLEIATALGRLLTGTTDARALELLRALREGEQFSAPELEIAFARVAPTQYLHEAPFKNLFLRPAESKLAWQSVAAVAQGLGELARVPNEKVGNSALTAQADAQLALRALLSDNATAPLAVPDVLNGVAAYKPSDLAPLLRAQLKSPDVIVRATAAGLLAELPPDSDTARALAAALPVALHDSLNDATLAILDALAKQKSEPALAALRTTLDAPDYLVRRRAATLLADAHAGGTDEARNQTVATRNRPADYKRALARAAQRVQAVVKTDKGEFTIELLPAVAPLTVDNFVALARRGFFDDVAFHRVVPNFVIQGGDPRGDGNGGPGYQIRCEINQVSYGRGAVGMALSGKDTGGSQWFVTHAPQPHLDGGYTVFGRVTQGQEVVDRIARGDRIRSVNVTEGPPAQPKPRRTR